ncbi:MAG: hypothetical protein KGJ35_00170 [Patescibacteria group bacterium]|nr:hypothetical protein [Patescibacteria group bacterium]
MKNSKYFLVLGSSLVAILIIFVGFTTATHSVSAGLTNQGMGGGDSIFAPYDPSVEQTPTTCDSGELKATNDYNSIMNPTGITLASTTVKSDLKTDPCFKFLKFYSVLSTKKTDSLMKSTNVCQSALSIPHAIYLQSLLSSYGLDINLTNPSTLYAEWEPVGAIHYQLFPLEVPNQTLVGAAVPGATLKIYYCTDPGYVSNYPGFVQRFITFVNAHKAYFAGNGRTLNGGYGTDTPTHIKNLIAILRGGLESYQGLMKNLDVSTVYAAAGSLLPR